MIGFFERRGKLGLYGVCGSVDARMQRKGARRALLLSVLIIIMDASAGATSYENVSDFNPEEDLDTSCDEGWCRSDMVKRSDAPSDAGPAVE